MTGTPYRETPEGQALIERHRARMAEPGYRESLIPPPPEVSQRERGRDEHVERRASRPLPDWMPTPEELHRWKYDWLAEECNLALEDEFRLVDAVRWLLEERENRL